MNNHLSKKQIKILAFPYSEFDALICDGAVRSGKTSIMTVAFVDWAMREFNGVNFAICGKTVGSTIKNIITPYMALSYARGRYGIKFNRSENKIVISRGSRENNFYIYGGKDESSQSLIQGITLAGVLLDEVALMPRSFVEQALARCSVEGAKFWFSCNPDSSQHWFYLEWILKANEKNALHLHFEMKDNPSLSQKTLERYENMYSGVFYDRYIKGLWCVAEGLVYPDFGENNITDEVPERGEYYISVDYGTVNPFSAGLWLYDGDKAVRVDEYYFSSRKEGRQKTDEEYYSELKTLAGNNEIEYIVVDPSAASFIECIRRHGEFSVRGAKNDVIDGIRVVSNMLKRGKVLIHKRCKDAITEFKLYRWDEKGTLDKVIKENDHAMDDIRYFCNTVLIRLLDWDW